jgi:hypothetical protein
MFATSADTFLELKYAYRKCSNSRTTKQNGELHTLCDFHRSKANSVQKIYARRVRRMKSEMKKQLQRAKTKAKRIEPCINGAIVEPIPFLNGSHSMVEYQFGYEEYLELLSLLVLFT